MSNRTRQTQLLAQIQKRIEVLSRWLKDDPQDRAVVPKSLTKVRTWTDAKLGIRPIGSSSSFTKTHDKYGHLIAQIEELLLRLNKKPDKRRRKSARVQATEWRQEKADLQGALVAAANRYAIQNVELQETKRLLRIAQQALKSNGRREPRSTKLHAAGPAKGRSRQAARSSNIMRVDFRGHRKKK